MCYVVGSFEQATSTCPMCKVFKPIGSARCPHLKEVCRNTQNHPRGEVMFLKNAEVQTFNGCGFCKWAKTNPPAARAGYQNSGWPGCCRQPSPNEHKYVGAADWPAVSLVHHIPIPPEIKAILDDICVPTSPRGTPPLSSPTTSVRVAAVQSAAPGMSRRSSYNVASPTKAESGTTRSNAVAIPTKGRSGGSPQQVTAPLSSVSRAGAGDGSSSSLPTASSMDQYQGSRRSAMDVFADKRPDPSNTSQNSPGRKHVELSGSVARRSTERRPSISSLASPKAGPDPASQRRRTVPTTTPTATVARRTEVSVERVSVERVSAERTPERVIVERAADAAPARRGSTIEEVADKAEKMSLASSASSSSSGSSSETTVISDGGFTDYLSDESEAELQRQAEAKAAILAQNRMEELEFKAARQQLEHVDLRPPRSWRGDVQSAPRSQIQPNRNATTYGQPAFAAGAPAYTATAASAHSRG